MTQKQIGLFRFDYPETQSDEAFVCIISPEKKLSLDAPEYIPSTYSVQRETTIFFYDLFKKDFDSDDDVSTSSCEEDQASTNSEFQCSDSNSESDFCSEDTSGSISEPSQSESDNEICYEESHSNSQKLRKILKMNHVPQSLKVSVGKMT